MCFRTYGLRKSWLDKCLKIRVSEHRLTVNMLKRPKHCWNLYGTGFIIIFHHSEVNSIGKSVS